MAEFVMPILGADMLAATLVAWKKKPGDPVKKGDIVAEVETDKGLIEVEIFTAGVIDKILVQPGTEVPVGTLLAIIREEGAPPAPIPAEVPRPAAPPPPVPPSVMPPPTRPPEAGRLRISPLARKRAGELGVDPAAVKGTGPGGAITRKDIERAATVKPPLDRIARMRQTIGAAMARSKREIPHYYLQTTIDLHRAMTWLTEENQKRAVPDRLLYGVLLIKAVALALREVPELNSIWREGKVVQSKAIHVGVAISLRQGGLVAPALHDADHTNLDTLMRHFRDLVQRARSGSLRSSELSDSTITLTSLGEQGVEGVYPIIYPPQVAIVGFGKIVERPWVAEGRVVPRPVITATLAGDHRVTDGHRGGLFLAAVDRLLQEPSRL